MQKEERIPGWRWHGGWRFSWLWLGAAFFGCTILNLAWEREGKGIPREPVRTFERPSGQAVKLSDRAYQRLGEKDDILFCEYGFFNFNSDFLKINYQIPRRALEEYLADYGYDDAEFRRLDREHQRSYDNAVDYANSHRLSQSHLDALIRNIDRQYKINLNVYMASRCFKVLKGNIAQVDMPDLVKRNVPRLVKVANAFERIARQGRYDTLTTIGAATSFVQLALRYEIPPKVRGGRNTGGILPPLEALMSGWGDCDTKTALLASILGNWELVRMVGVALPHHYLMAIRCSPNKGDMYVRFQGVDYLLIDPAGPAWLPPGQISENSYDSLQDDEGYLIEPFY